MKSKEDIKHFYDEATIRKLHGLLHSNERVEYAWQSLIAVPTLNAAKRILEIGSGIGEISYRLASVNKKADVFGFDISDESVKIAGKLFVLPNLTYVRADSIVEAGFSNNTKFDIIFLMDVYEHIPLEERDDLHKFIKQNIAEDGFVFISCPTPQHLNYLRKNTPAEIQPIDENISLNELITFSNQTNVKLIFYKEVSVWRAGDYFHALFSNYLDMRLYSDYKSGYKSEPLGLKREILNKMKKVKRDENSIDTFSLIQERKNLIKTKLGDKILERVESFKL